jgi:hypothetical protein
MRRHAEIDDSKRKKSCQSSPRSGPLMCARGESGTRWLEASKHALKTFLIHLRPGELRRPFQHRRNPLPLLPAPNPRFHSLIRRSPLGSEARNGSGPVSAPLQSRFFPFNSLGFWQASAPQSCISATLRPLPEKAEVWSGQGLCLKITQAIPASTGRSRSRRPRSCLI